MRDSQYSSPFHLLPLLMAGAAVGLVFPDIDQIWWLRGSSPSSFFYHRSMLTHGILVSLLLLYLVYKQGFPANTGLRIFTIAFSLANAVHFSLDLFPRSWGGPALIHIPCYGWTGVAFSVAWLLASIVLCLYFACSLLKNMLEFLLSTAIFAVTFWITAIGERRSEHLLAAAMVLILASLFAFAMSSRYAIRKA